MASCGETMQLGHQKNNSFKGSFRGTFRVPLGSFRGNFNGSLQGEARFNLAAGRSLEKLAC